MYIVRKTNLVSIDPDLLASFQALLSAQKLGGTGDQTNLMFNTHTCTLTHAHSHPCTSHLHTHTHTNTCTSHTHTHMHTHTHPHSQQPCTPSFEDAISFARKNQFDGFLAVGGGSVMDTAKVANLLSCCPENELLDFTNAPVGKGQPVTKPLKPLICSK